MRSKFRETFLILSVLALFIFGIALIVISYLPFNEVKALFDPIALDGDFKSFSIKHVLQIRFSGIFICLIGGMVYIFRKRILQYALDFKISDFLINPKNILGLIYVFIKDSKEAFRKEDKIHTYALILIILLAIAIRIFYLNFPSIPDETNIIESRIYHSHGVRGFIQLITGYYVPGDHMFQTVLSFLTYKLFGSEQSIWTIRLPAFLAGILLVPVTYIVVRSFYNKHSALFATSIIAASSYHIQYASTLARGYSMICLFFFLILALGAYLIRNNNLAGWHLFAILSAFGFYTIPIMLWPYGIVITWIMLSIIFKDTHIKRSYLLKNLFISIAVTVLLTFILYSPVIVWGTGIKSFYAYPITHPSSITARTTCMQ